MTYNKLSQYPTGNVVDTMYHLALELVTEDFERQILKEFVDKMDSEDVLEERKRLNLALVILRICQGGTIHRIVFERDAWGANS